MVRTLKGHTSWISWRASAQTAPAIVTATYDQTAKLWDDGGARSARSRGTPHGSGRRASARTACTSSPRVGQDGEAVGRAKRRGGAHAQGAPGAVTSANFSSDGTRIVTAGGDGMVKVWDTTPINRELLAARNRHCSGNGEVN